MKNKSIFKTKQLEPYEWFKEDRINTIHLLLLLSILLTLTYTFCMWIGFVKVMNEIEVMRIEIERSK